MPVTEVDQPGRLRKRHYRHQPRRRYQIRFVEQRRGRPLRRTVGASSSRPLSNRFRIVSVGKTATQILCQLVLGWHVTTKDLEVLSELIAAGKVRPQIDRRYRFADIPAAIANLEQDHAKAKVVAEVA
jgi:hypothetical protein